MSNPDSPSNVELPKQLGQYDNKFSACLGGDDTFVTVSDYKDNVYIHIRKYDTNEDGKLFPTKKGAALIPCRWNELLMSIDDIKKAVPAFRSESYSKHLGGNWYVSVSKDIACVDIRRFWQPEEGQDVVPTRKGIGLRFTEFEELVKLLDEINSYVPELADVIPCLSREDHQNQLGALKCSECNPNDCQNW